MAIKTPGRTRTRSQKDPSRPTLPRPSAAATFIESLLARNDPFPNDTSTAENTPSVYELGHTPRPQFVVHTYTLSDGRPRPKRRR